MRCTFQLGIVVGILASCTNETRFDAPAASFTVDSARIEAATSKSIVARVDSSFFNASPVRPLLGRSLMSQEYADRAPIAILSNALWTERLKRNPAIIGSRLKVDDMPYTVVGVMPPGVDLPKGVALWIPRD